jgi:hypothetical protein
VREVLNTAMKVNFQALSKFAEEASALGDQQRRLAKHYLLLAVSIHIFRLLKVDLSQKSNKFFWGGKKHVSVKV